MIKNKFDQLEGALVVKIIAGGGNGSILLMEIQKGHIEYIIYIYCVWRLFVFDSKRTIIGWNDDLTDLDSNSIKQLKSIENSFISNVKINEHGDFVLSFDNESKLSVFCDITSDGEKAELEDNWTLCDTVQNVCYNFNNRFNIVTTKYTE